MDVVTDADVARRLTKGLIGFYAVRRSEDHINVEQFFGANMMPESPNPFAVRTQSKRDWELEVQVWRRTLQSLASVVMPVVLQSGAWD